MLTLFSTWLGLLSTSPPLPPAVCQPGRQRIRPREAIFCQVRAAHDAASTTSLALSNYSTELDSVSGIGLDDLFFFLLILMAVVLAMTTAYVIIDCHMMRRRFLAAQDQRIRLDRAAEDNAAIRHENAGHRAVDPVDPVREDTQAPPEARPVEHDAASSSSANINGVGSETGTASTTTTNRP